MYGGRRYDFSLFAFFIFYVPTNDMCAIFILHQKMVMDCIEVVKEKEPNLTEEEFMQKIIDGHVTPPHSVALPWSFDTPSKSKHY